MLLRHSYNGPIIKWQKGAAPHEKQPLNYTWKINKFNTQTLATTARDEINQYVQLSDGSIINLKVLDTAGQERYNAIFENYYRQADCCLLIYDIIAYYINPDISGVIIGFNDNINNDSNSGGSGSDD